MYIEKGTFKIDDVETVELEGQYDISLMTNELYVPNPDSFEDENIRNQAVCLKANVLRRTDTENVNELIKVIMRYTHDPCDDLDLDKSVESSEVMIGGTICPRRRVLFVYKSKAFVTFGRYIFGYDEPHVKIHRTSPVPDTKSGDVDTSVSKADVADDDDDDDDTCSSLSDSKKEEKEDDDYLDDDDDDDYVSDESDPWSDKNRISDKITSNNIVLNVPDYDDGNDYVYSFMIYDKESNVLDAFGLYR